VPLAVLAAPCILRDQAIDTMRSRNREYRIAFTGSSVSSVQAAVLAGLGISILPLSSVVPGMQIIPNGRNFPNPGRLHIGVLRGEGVPEEIVVALEHIVRQLVVGGPPGMS